MYRLIVSLLTFPAVLAKELRVHKEGHWHTIAGSEDSFPEQPSGPFLQLLVYGK